jgi:hypothetical protein
MQLQAISLGFYTDAQWTSFPSFCQRCYSSLTELLTEMGHYTEAGNLMEVDKSQSLVDWIDCLVDIVAETCAPFSFDE